VLGLRWLLLIIGSQQSGGVGSTVPAVVLPSLRSPLCVQLGSSQVVLCRFCVGVVFLYVECSLSACAV
jgi:hypothetical protein